MPSAREINRRIKSVTNTQQITKAMKMVSSVRLRRAQDRAVATAPYTEKMEGMLQRLSAASPDAGNALFTPHDTVKKTCYIIIGSDKGLAGAFNSNVNKAIVSVLKDKPRDASMLLVAGRKPLEYLKHLHLVPEKKWSGFSDKPQFSHAQQIAHLATQKFLDGEVDEVYVIYTHFKSALSQDTRIVKMLPITQKEGQQEGGPREESEARPRRLAAAVSGSVHLQQPPSVRCQRTRCPYDGHDVGYGQRRRTDRQIDCYLQ